MDTKPLMTTQQQTSGVDTESMLDGNDSDQLTANITLSTNNQGW